MNGERTGSTVLEAIVALGILSVVGTALVSGAVAGIGVGADAKRAAAEAAEVLMLDDAVRRYAVRIRVPYWDHRAPTTGDAGNFAVKWLDGAAEAELRLREENGRIVIEADGQTVSFPGCAEAEFAAVGDERGAVKGVEVKTVLNGRQLRIVAPFGAAALAGGAP